MKKLLLHLSAAILLSAPSARGQQKLVTLNSELQRLCDIAQLPKYISGSYEAQRSSYDTTGGNDDGFSGKYSFVHKDADGTLVIFEAKGKGVINRIWTATPNDDTLDFYFDGKNKPACSIRFSDLFSGKVFPFVGPLCGRQLGGNFCYLPIPFQNGCKIVSRGKLMQFYQIQYRHYPNEYAVKTFDPDLSVAERATLEKIKKLWGAGERKVTDFYPGRAEVVKTNATIGPGRTITLFDRDKGGRIVGLEIEAADIKEIDLKITWDGEQNPAVYAPLSDFFGYAFGSPSMQSLLLGCANGKNYCYFPMPFDRSAKIELVDRGNTGGRSKTIKANVYYTDKKRDPLTEGKFYTCWNSDLNVAKGKPHVFLNVTGKGHYVGSILQAQGLNAGMTTFFEGDDSTSVDGVMRIHGTGSEDYFNGGWYALMDRWDTRMSLPLHGALDYSLPFSRTGGYRLYLNDKISYSKSIFQSMEHGPQGNAVPANYTSMALYYSDTPVSEITRPSARMTKSFLPDTLMLYPQLMNFSIWGDISVKPGFDAYVFTAANDARLRISLSEIPFGHYKLYAELKKDAQGADIAIWQRQTVLSDWMSLRSEKPVTEQQLYLCDITIGDFKNTLTIVFRSKEDGNKLSLSRLIFVREKG